MTTRRTFFGKLFGGVAAVIVAPKLLADLIRESPRRLFVPASPQQLNKLWHKIQGDLRPGFQFMTEEFEEFTQFKNFDVNWATGGIEVDLATGDIVST